MKNENEMLPNINQTIPRDEFMPKKTQNLKQHGANGS